MAYRPRRFRRGRRTYRSSYGYRSRYRSYGRRRTYGRGRRVRSRGRAARIVLQVVGGAGGVAASPAALGMKAAKPVRARY